MRRRTWIFSALAALALGAVPVARTAAAPTQGEPAFLAEVEKARRLLAAGNAKEGMRVTAEALRAHEDQDYARAKRAELEDLVKRLAFRAECPPPDPKTLVRGDLQKYVSKTGELKIVYTDPKDTDFETTKKGNLLFPARFSGPFSAVARGSCYPSTTESSPQVTVGMEEDPKTRRRQTWTVLPGIPPYETGNRIRWLPAKLIHDDGDQEKVVAEKETSLAKAGEPWKIEVKVGRSRITATYNAKPIGTANKPETVFGYLILDCPGWDEIAIEGQVEPAWIQGKIDAVVDEKRGAFEARFRAREHLPDWLYAPSKAAPAAAAEAPDWPDVGEIPEAAEADFARAAAHFEKDEDAEALAAIEEARAHGAPAALVDLMAARAYVGLDRLSDALAAIDRTVAALPGIAEPLVLKATVLAHLGRDDEASAAWKAVVALPAADAGDFAAACLSLLGAGRIDEARATAETAARRGKTSKLLDAIGRVLVQAHAGPAWPKTFEHKSTNYHVVSDIDAETCARAATVLEESLTVYRSQVRALKPQPQRLYKVCLFSGEAGFARYRKDLDLFERGGHGNAAGLYSPLLKQLLIWNLPSRDEMMRTVRHEGFHQYLDRLLPDAPTWFDEGMAVYFEGMRRIGGGELRTDLPRHDDLALLSAEGLVPLERFLHVPHKDFYEGGHRSYAQAWLMVHMLRHGSTKHRELYRALLAKLETSAADEAVRTVFPASIVPGLDADLRAHLVTLSKQK
jgi:hypothetical protein